jgi:hypothetical protein
VPETAVKSEDDTGGPAPSAPPLDDVMLAMDVVDTLRHAEQLVERELSSEERDRQLKERLRQIYATQGIEVPDHVLDDGVKALKEERFVYHPPQAGGGRWLAMLWVRRKVWGTATLAGIALLLALGLGYLFFIKMPAERQIAEQAEELQVGLPQAFEQELDRIRAIAKADAVIVDAEALAAEGNAAAKAGDLEAGRAKVAALQDLRERLDQEYEIRVVSRPDLPSGVFRIPESNPGARNYYLIVEALDPRGEPVSISVMSEEDGTTRSVKVWGLRVEETTFARVRADKSDDGIIQNDRIGSKRRGYLEPEYAVPVEGGAILEW